MFLSKYDIDRKQKSCRLKLVAKQSSNNDQQFEI